MALDLAKGVMAPLILWWKKGQRRGVSGACNYRGRNGILWGIFAIV